MENKIKFPQIKKNQLILILLIGILLLVVAIPTEKKENQVQIEDCDTQDLKREGISKNGEEKYISNLEKKLKETLECVEGVGKVEVLITLKSTGQKIVEKDRNSNIKSSDEKDATGGTREVKDEQQEKQSVYIHDTDGSQKPYISKEMLPEIAGVLVVADGGAKPVVIQNITEAVQALFGVEVHKIKIMKRSDK